MNELSVLDNELMELWKTKPFIFLTDFIDNHQHKDYVRQWYEKTNAHPLPFELESEIREIYRNSPEYFNYEHSLTPTHKEYINQWYKNKNEQIRKEKEENDIKILMRQTSYTKEQAIESLHKNKTIEKCIEEYLGVDKKSNMNKSSTNQAIYKSLREWLN